jgi:hypothetical protein
MFFHQARETEQAQLHWGSVHTTVTTGTWHDKWAHLWTSVHSIQYRYKVRQRRWDRILCHSICHVASTRLDNKCRVLLLWHRPLNTSKHWTTHIPTELLRITVSFLSNWYIHWPCYIIKTFQTHTPYSCNLLQEALFMKINFQMNQLQTLTFCSPLMKLSFLRVHFLFCCPIIDCNMQTGLRERKNCCLSKDNTISSQTN